MGHLGRGLLFLFLEYRVKVNHKMGWGH